MCKLIQVGFHEDVSIYQNTIYVSCVIIDGLIIKVNIYPKILRMMQWTSLIKEENDKLSSLKKREEFQTQQ